MADTESSIRSAVSLAAVLVAAVAIPVSSAAAQPTPPSSFPPDSAYGPVSCADPTAAPSSDPCADEARDHRNIIGAGATPAFLLYQDGTYLYLRVRVEDDPRQGGALVAFAWGFGLDVDGDGAFEAYVTLIGQGMADRLEIQDQDASNGTTPDLALPTGGGTDTSLRPIDTTGMGATWATVTPAPPVGGMANFCPDDPDGGDWYITVAVPLSALADFGALGAAVAYGGSSSEFSGIQNDIVCADGDPASCTTGATCPTGVCLTEVGNCAPPVVPTFLGCVAMDRDMDGIHDGCSASLRRCLVTPMTPTTPGSSRCVACISAADCDDTNACTTDACVANACVFTPRSAGTMCTGGVCNGSTPMPACVACVDDAPGTMRDTGCAASAPVCDVSGPRPRCTGCMVAADCNDGNACTTDACTAGVCSRTPVMAATLCPGGVCNGSMTMPACVACLDNAPGTMLDAGCAIGAPVCDTSGAMPRCSGCTTSADCNDGNACTTDACTAGLCVPTSLAAGSTCPGGVCDGAPSSPMCLACVDDAPGTMRDSGCSAATPVCNTSGAVPVCVGCTTSADCNDGNACTTDACTGGACAATAAAAGTVCPSGVCDGSTTMPACIACIDDAEGTLRDTGCSMGSPVCDTSGGAPRCTGCASAADCDDGNECTLETCESAACMSSPIANGTMCTAGVCSSADALPACVPCIDDAEGTTTDSGCRTGAALCDASGASPVCVACVDLGTGIDLGCAAPTPVCGNREGESVCVECTVDPDCPEGEVCDVPAGTCATGCDEPSDCAAPTPVCDLSAGLCVACLVDPDCAGRQLCTAEHVCAFADHDDDGIPDDIDLDDDNDGIPDTAELGGDDLSLDSDGDGIQDFEDPDAADCTDTNGDDVCDELAPEVDFDGDGSPNHLDLDADGDGLTDLLEGGGQDADDDGTVDGFVDADDNGLDDALMDEPLPLPNTDGDGGPDFLDLDADGDAASDATEGTDSNHDGMPDREPSGDDENGNGIDDAFDRGTGGAAPAEPDTDGDGTPDWRDRDDDGDAVPSSDEDVDRDGVPANDDTDADGTPNYLDPDDDGDSIPTRDEDTNGNGSYQDDDSDGDGTPNYLDPEQPRGGWAGGACSARTASRDGDAAAGSTTLVPLALALLLVALRRRRS